MWQCHGGGNRQFHKIENSKTDYVITKVRFSENQHIYVLFILKSRHGFYLGKSHAENKTENKQDHCPEN